MGEKKGYYVHYLVKIFIGISTMLVEILDKFRVFDTMMLCMIDIHHEDEIGINDSIKTIIELKDNVPIITIASQAQKDELLLLFAVCIKMIIT